MFRDSSPEMFSKKDTVQIGSKPQENNRAEARSQQSCFATLLKSHLCTDAPLRMHSTPTKHLSPGEYLWETAPDVKKSFKRLKL